MFVCVETVSANSEKIGAEELQCKAMAENAQRDLDEALPALEEAMKVNRCPVSVLLVLLSVQFVHHHVCLFI